jgi:Holliday junction resolvase RusA-like endonuclease
VNQRTATKISNAILDWRDAETISLFEFDIKPVPGNQHDKNHRKRPEVKAFQELVEGAANEQITQKAEDDHLGIRIAIVQVKRSGDLDNFAKSIIDGLKQIAFGDDKIFNYTEQVRVRADTPQDEGFTVELLRLTQKRDVGIW